MSRIYVLSRRDHRVADRIVRDLEALFERRPSSDLAAAIRAVRDRRLDGADDWLDAAESKAVVRDERLDDGSLTLARRIGYVRERLARVRLRSA